MVKYSRQREAVKTFLMSRKDHPTAEFVYQNVREEYPNISLGTVYRNLTFLVENGEAIKISCGDKSEHFDGNPKPHYHFYCKECGGVSDLDMDDLSFMNTLASKNFNGQIWGHNTVFYGICENCSKN
ncbi:MAG: transcriptional repressor [Lachnospiraceae bacterium]|nr:transcriptional repressor [Lachnospiraceae bacterium]